MPQASRGRPSRTFRSGAERNTDVKRRITLLQTAIITDGRAGESTIDIAKQHHVPVLSRTALRTNHCDRRLVCFAYYTHGFHALALDNATRRDTVVGSGCRSMVSEPQPVTFTCDDPDMNAVFSRMLVYMCTQPTQAIEGEAGCGKFARCRRKPHERPQLHQLHELHNQLDSILFPLCAW